MLQGTLSAHGWNIVDSASKATYVVYADDPNRGLFILPPRKRQLVMENIRSHYKNKGWPQTPKVSLVDGEPVRL